MDLRATVVLALVAAANAVPINVRQYSRCSIQCVESTKFKYGVGGTYRYDYEGSVQSTVFGSSEGASGMTMKATADIEMIDSCDLALRLLNVRLEETDKTGRSWAVLGAETFRRALQEDPLRFSFQDGRIEEVCPMTVEDPWITNIKRGVLSSFQNSMDDFGKETRIAETDVAGNCQADYKIMSRQYTTVTVNKTKDLLACTDRHGFKTAMQTTPYRVASEIQSLPLTKSSHTCVQTLSTTNGRLMKANCEEHHIFRPFSKGQNGALTHAKHSLEFVGMRPGVRTPLSDNIRRSNMLFEHEKETTKTSRDTSGIESTLNAICEETVNDIRPGTPKLFSDLVYKMKELEPITLRQVHRQVISKRVCQKNHEAAKKYFYDAVPMAGTPGSVGLISDLVKSHYVRDSEADMWTSSLAFVQNPTKEMLNSVKDLLYAPNPRKTAYLACSALVNNYCKKNDNCLTEPAVQQIQSLLERNLNSRCKVGRTSLLQILMSLKALGNMANAPSSDVVLGQCFTDNTNEIEIRLAALEALRRQPCTADRRQALRIYTDTDEDSEMRIAGYITAMSCATEETIKTVEGTLETEKVNQVGSYVWTHLTNLMETSDPHKQYIRQILDSTILKKTFDLDKRKYSRNFESSMFFDSINTGAKVEGNLIWSEKSYVPRSAMFNMTFDLFGHSVNLMEFGGRAEGLEHMIEKYFGSNGYFSDNNVKNILKKRGKRSISDDKMNLIENQFFSEKMEDPKGSLYFKIFGQEISYTDIMQMPGRSDFNILEVLIKLASNHDINFSKSIMFLDTTMTIPTVVGFPLKLSVNGTATLNVQMRGKMDIRKLHPSPRTVDIDGSFKPSAAVEISSMMSVDANVARTGLKMVTTLHSSTAIQGKVQIQDSQIVNVNFDMPQDKIEIISAENKFYIVHQSQEIEQRMIDSSRVNTKKCTGDGLTKALGIELCGELSYPTTPGMTDVPVFPMTGPAKMSVVLNKMDTHTGYNFEAILKKTKIRSSGKTAITQARLGFDTPGSQVDREFLFDFNLNQGDRALNFELKSPWKKVNLNGALVHQDDLKRATIRLMVDETKEYAVVAEMQTDVQGDKKTYTPNIEINIPERQPILIAGSFTYSKATNKYLEYSLDVQQLFTTPVTMTGSIRKDVRRGDRNRYNTAFDLQSPALKTQMNGFLDCRADNYKSRVSLTYQWQKRREETINLNFKGRNSLTRTMRKMLVDTAITLSAYPKYDTHVKWDAETTDSHFETSLDLKYGPDPNDQSKRISASTIVNYEKHGTKFNADARVKLYVPAQNINVEASGKHYHHSKSVETKLEVEYKPGKRINAQINLNNLSGRLAKYSGSASLVYPGRQMGASAKIEQTRLYEYHTSSMVQWQSGRQIREKSMFKYEDETFFVNSDIEIPDIDPVTIEGNLKPKIQDFAAMLKVHAMNDIYSGDVAYAYTQQGKQLTGTASADVVYPGRHIVGTSEMKLFVAGEHSLKMDVKWDADNDETKAITVDGLYKLQSYSYLTKHEATVTVTYPGRTVLLEAAAEKSSGKYKSHILVDWEDDKMLLDVSMVNIKTDMSRSIAGNIRFQSPFKYVQDLGAGLVYENNGKTYRAGGNVTWAPTMMITADGLVTVESLKDMGLEVAVLTPFGGLQKMGLKGKYLVQQKEMSLILGGEADEKKVEVELTGKYKDTIEGALKVDLPFLARSFGASFTHKGDQKQYVTSAEVSWDRSNKILANLDLNLMGVKNFGGTLEIETPFSPVRKIGLVIIHSIENNEMTSRLSGNWEDKQMTVEVKGKNNNTPYRRDMEGSVRITTPFNNFDDMSLSLKHNDDSHIYTSSMSAAWQRTKRVTASFYMKHARQDWNVNNNGKITITTPYRRFQRVGYEWKHTNAKSSLDSQHTVDVNGKQWGVALAGNIRDQDGYTAEGTVDIKTPLQGIRRINTALGLEITRTKLGSNIAMTISGRRSSMNFNLEGTTWKNMKGTINVDVGNLIELVMVNPPRLPSFDTEFTLQALSMPYRAFIKVNYPDRVYIIDATATPRGWDFAEMKISLTTPITNYENVVFDLQHSLTREASDSSITLSYQPEKTILLQVKSNFEAYEKIKADLILTSPFENVRSFKINLDHDKDYRGFTDKAGFEYEGKTGKIAFSTGLTYYGLRFVSGSMNFQTPYQHFETLGAGFTLQGQSTKMMLDANIEYQTGQKVVIKSVVEYDPVTVTFALTTPFEVLSSVTLNLQHSGVLPQTESSFSFVSLIFEEETTISGRANMRSLADMNANVNIVTPYAGVQNVKVLMAYKREETGVASSINIDLGSNKKINAVLTLAVPAYSGSIEITTPFPGYREIKADYGYEKATVNLLPHLITTASVKIGAVGAAFELKVDGLENWKAKFDINTPDRYLLNLEYVSEEDLKYRLGGILEYPEGKNELTFTYQPHMTYQPFALKLMVKTPFYFLTSMSLDLEHSGTWGQFDHSMVFDYDAYISRVHIENKWNIDGLNHIVGDARMTSPIKHMEYVGFSVNHIAEEKEIASSLSLEFSPGKRINVKNEVKFDDKFEIDFEVTTPFKYGRIAAIKIEHEGGWKMRKNEITLEFDSTKLVSEWERESWSSVTGEMKFTSRIPGWERMTLNVKHEMEGQEAVTEVEVKLPSSEKITIDATTKTNNRPSIKIQLHSPFEAVSSAELELSYMKSVPNYRFKYGMTNWQVPMHLEGNFRMPKAGIFNGNLDFSSSYQGYEMLALSASNNILDSKFVTDVTLSLSRRKKIELKSRIDISIYSVDITLTTPYRAVQRAYIKYEQESSPGITIKNLFVVEHLSRKGLTKLDGNFELDVSRNMKFEAKLTSPYPKLRLLSLAHTQNEAAAMKVETVMQYNDKRIEYIANQYRKDGNLIYEHSLKTPWERAGDIQLNYEYPDFVVNPTFKKFFIKYDMKHNMWDKNLKYEIRWDIKEDSYVASVLTSSMWYKDTVLSFSHVKLGYRNCETNVDAAYDDLLIEYKSTFYWPSFEDFNGMIMLNFPIPGKSYEKNNLEFSHAGNLNHLQSSASIATSSFGKYAAALEWDTPSKKGVLKVETPFTGWETIDLDFSHVGTTEDFITLVTVKIPNKEMTTKIEFKLNPTIALKAEINIPIEYGSLINPKLVYSLDGTMSNFRASLKVSAPRTLIDSSCSFQKASNYLKFTGSTTTPFFHKIESLGMTLLHNGPMNNFETDLQLSSTIEREERKITANVNFKNQYTKSLKVRLNTPFLNAEENYLEFNHHGEEGEYETTGKLDYMRGKRINAKVNIKTTSEVSFKADLETPYENFENNMVEVGFSGHSRRFNANGKIITYGNKEGGFTLNYMNYNFRRLMTTLNVYTPITGYESMTVKVTHNGNSDSFRTVATYEDVRNTKMESTVEFSGRPITLTAKIISPYLVFDATHSGGLHMFQTTGSLDVYDMMFKTDAMFNLASYTGTLNVFTPWTNVHLSHNGDYSKFKSNATFTYSGEKVEMVASFDQGPIDAQFHFNSPYASLKFLHNGPLKNFRTSSQLTYSGNTINAVAMFSKNNKISGSATLTTPFKYVRDMAVTFSHFGSMRQFKSDGSVQWDTNKKIESTLEFRRSKRTIAVSTKVDTPFEDFEKMSFTVNHNGPKTQFRTTMTAQYMTRKIIRATATYQHLKRGTFTFSSPIQYIQSIAASFNAAKVNNKDGYHAEISWAPRQTLVMDVTGSYDGVLTSASANGYLKVRTPFTEAREVIIEMDHSHSRSYFGNTLKVDYNSETFIDTNVISRQGDGKINTEVTMSAPWPVKVNLNLHNHDSEKTADVQVHWDTTRPEKKVSLNLDYKKEGGYYRREYLHSIRLSVPRRVFVISSKIDRTSNQFAHTASASMNNKQITYTSRINNLSTTGNTDVNGNIILSTPYRTLRSEFKYQRNQRTINLEYDWFWNADEVPDAKAGLRLKVDDYKETYGANFELTVLPPYMQKGYTLKNTMTKRRDMIETMTEYKYSEVANEKVTLNTRWSVIRTGPHNNYTSTIELNHPRTLTDITLTGHVGTSYSKGSAGANLDYLTATRQMKIFRLRAEIDHVKDTLDLQVQTPMKTIHMNGKKATFQNGFLLTHQSIHDGEDSISSNLKLDLSVPSFDYNINYDPENLDNVFKMYGKYLSNKEVVYETFRQHNGRHISEIYLSARLNSTRVLHSRIHWRPTLWNDIKKSTLALLEDSHPLMQAWTKAKEAVEKEIELKSAILDATLPGWEPIKTVLDQEIESLKEDVVQVMTVFKQMYNANEFYLKDISVALDKALTYIGDKATVLNYQIRQQIAAFRRNLRAKMVAYRRTMTEMSAKIEESIAAVVLKFRPAWQSYVYSVIKGYETTSQKINDGWEDLIEAVDESWADFVKTMDEKFDFISFKFEAYLVKIKDFQDGLRAKLMSSKQKRWFDKIRDRVIAKLNEWKAKWDAWTNEVKTDVTTMYNNVVNSVNSRLEKILGHRYAQVVIKAMQKAGKKISDRFSKWQLKSKLVKYLKTTYAKLKIYAKAQLKNILDSYMRLENTGFTVFDPRNGEIQFELWLPLELKTLKEFPDISLDTLKQEWTKLKNKYWPESDYSFWDTYYKFKPNADYFDWIPPFKASAMLTHGRHFTTFDGQHFDFAGTCSYLLTKDFTDGNFSVVVNYNNGKKTSLIVTSNDKDIEIFPDFKVSIDDSRIELPYQHMNTTVIRSGYTIRVHNTKGFTMTCDMAHDICTFNVTGWYFGRLAGMLGTYNNEQYDDKLTADRRILDDTEQFARTWEVGRYCPQSRNLARQATTTVGSKTDKLCKKYFEDSKSVFRPCFKMVEPAPYLESCISDIEQDYTTRSVEQKSCGVLASYVSKCRRFGVPIRVPPTCVTCSGVDGDTFSDGESQEFDAADKPSTKSADVVFVVEERSCNVEAARKLIDMGVQIDNALKAQGLRNNRFAVVGFGGQGVHDLHRSHTTEGKLFNDARKLHLAINSLTFDAEGTNTDMLRAVKFASDYPFRTGVSKTIIILPCSECKAQAIGYGEMQTIVAEKDITMHILVAHDFKLRTNSPVKTSYIFGLDERGVFTNKDVNSPILTGDSVLKNQVIMPKDICVTLALETNGTVFNVQKLLEGRYSSQKSFLDVFARRLANGAHPTKCQVCECTSDANGVGRSLCRNCDTQSFNIFFKFLPQQLKQTAVEYNYGPKTSIPSLSEADGSSEFDLNFGEYMSHSSDDQLRTIRRQ